MFGLGNGTKLLEDKSKEPHYEDVDEQDLLYVLEKKVNTILQEKDREIGLLNAQIHDNNQFMQKVILELIARQPVSTVSTVGRSLNVPSTASVKEAMRDGNGAIAGPTGKLP